MEFRFWLRLHLLSLVLPVVGANGILRLRLVSILRMGRLGRCCCSKRVWSLGEHCVFSYRCCLGKSIYRKLWCGDSRRLSQCSDWQNYCRWTRVQHESLHWKHGRVSRCCLVQSEYWHRLWRRSWLCGQHLLRSRGCWPWRICL